MIEINQQFDYTLPDPAYNLGHNLVDDEQDEGFVIAMQYMGDEWEYRLFYRKLEVVWQWKLESKLASGILTI